MQCVQREKPQEKKLASQTSLYISPFTTSDYTFITTMFKLLA